MTNINRLDDPPVVNVDHTHDAAISNNSNQGSRSNSIWGINQGSQSQNRPVSFDSIWSNHASSIWSNDGKSNSVATPGASVPLSSPPGFLAQNNQQLPLNNPYQQQQQQQQTFFISPTKRHSYGDRSAAYSFSPQGSPRFDYHTLENSNNLTQFEINMRRHSIPDAYSLSGNEGINTVIPLAQRQQPYLQNSSTVPQHFQSQGPTRHNSQQGMPVRHQQQKSLSNIVNSNQDLKTAVDLVNDYFEKDTHQRVKVTTKLLEEKFREEEIYLLDSYQLPRFPVEHSLRNYQLVLVGFKAGRVDVFYLQSPTSPELADLKIGDLVIVEADRGRDLGKIFKMNISVEEARFIKLLQFQEQQAALNETEDNDISMKHLSEHSNVSNLGALHFPKSILSLAKTNEILQILSKIQDEEKACRLCLTKISNSTGMGNSSEGLNLSQPDIMQMKLIDAEYQFDRKKLIFYYSTHKRIDFRELVRELFRIYKTRIWMCAVIGLPYVPQQHQVQKPGITAGAGSKDIINMNNASPTASSPPLLANSSIGQQPKFQQFMQSTMTPQGSNSFGINLGSSGMNSNNDGAPLLLDPFSQEHTVNEVTAPIGPFDTSFARRTSMPSGYFSSRSTQIPRNFMETKEDEEIDRKKKNDEGKGGGESFVLKSLVDSINH